MNVGTLSGRAEGMLFETEAITPLSFSMEEVNVHGVGEIVNPTSTLSIFIVYSTFVKSSTALSKVTRIFPLTPPNVVFSRTLESSLVISKNGVSVNS